MDQEGADSRSPFDYPSGSNFRLLEGSPCSENVTGKQKGKLDQWIRRQDPEITPHADSYLIFDTAAKNMCSMYNSLSPSTRNWVSTTESRSLSLSLQAIQHKSITDIHRKLETSNYKHREESSKYCHQQRLPKQLLKGSGGKVKINKWDYIT